MVEDEIFKEPMYVRKMKFLLAGKEEEMVDVPEDIRTEPQMREWILAEATRISGRVMDNCDSGPAIHMKDDSWLRRIGYYDKGFCVWCGGAILMEGPRDARPVTTMGGTNYG